MLQSVSLEQEVVAFLQEKMDLSKLILDALAQLKQIKATISDYCFAVKAKMGKKTEPTCSEERATAPLRQMRG